MTACITLLRTICFITYDLPLSIVSNLNHQPRKQVEILLNRRFSKNDDTRQMDHRIVYKYFPFHEYNERHQNIQCLIYLVKEVDNSLQIEL